ncbi:YusW family protein [Alkalicoccus luteus]|uniref:YusW-like protein n=1 Tax=Alkalicoccus luteus TaxID=1237094 RepID=A0A969PKX6_9BACI|nr:YusW family protein [Alkalicoccus luteus]NJP36101.1 hypothetical protein [Alkalicoccus luteus]
MKKVMTGLAAVTLLTACGGLNSVEPEQNTSTAGQENEVETEINDPAADSSDENEAVNEENEENQAETNTETNEDNTADQENNETAGEEESAAADVIEFDLHIEFLDDTEWEYEFERNDLDDTEVERDGEETLTGEAAAAEIETLLAELDMTTDRPLEEMIQEVLEAAGAPLDEVDDVDVEVKYADGEEIVIDHEGRQQSGDLGSVREFDLDIDFFNGEDLEYEYETDGPEGEIERRDGSETEGPEAVEEIEELLGSISITMDRTIAEMKQEVLAELDIEEDEVEDFDIDVEYENGQTIKFKHDVE